MTGKEVREKHMKQKTMSRSKIVQCDFGKKDARMNEKISENRKRGVLLLLLVVLFWFVLLAVVPAMAAEKTCLVSVPVSVQLTGTAVSGQTENTPVFTVVMEAQNERNELPLPEQNQIQMGADGSGTFDAILYTTPGDYQYHIRQLAGTDHLLLGAYIGLVDIDGHFRKLFVKGRINMGEGCGSMFGSNTNT